MTYNLVNTQWGVSHNWSPLFPISIWAPVREKVTPVLCCLRCLSIFKDLTEPAPYEGLAINERLALQEELNVFSLKSILFSGFEGSFCFVFLLLLLVQLIDGWKSLSVFVVVTHYQDKPRNQKFVIIPAGSGESTQNTVCHHMFWFQTTKTPKKNPFLCL